jgi:hypothetical protein
LKIAAAAPDHSQRRTVPSIEAEAIPPENTHCRIAPV